MHDFRPEYAQMGFLHEMFPDVPIIALTATADKITREDIVRQLHLKEPKIFISSFDRPNLSLTVKRGYLQKEKSKAILEFISGHATLEFETSDEHCEASCNCNTTQNS